MRRERRTAQGQEPERRGRKNQARTQGFEPAGAIWIRSAETMRARGRKSRIDEAGHTTAPGRRLSALLRFPAALKGASTYVHSIALDGKTPDEYFENRPTVEAPPRHMS